jgi:hypothetical protein
MTLPEASSSTPGGGSQETTLPSPPQKTGAFEFLCLLAVAELTAERRARISSVDLALDWGEVLRLAEYHGILPLAAHNLIGQNLPPAIESSLRSSYQANLRCSLWFAAELARITQHFDHRHLRAVPYKGPVLAQSAYGDLGLRSFSDLDLLMSPADFDRAKRVLAEIEYRPTTEQAAFVERFWLRAGYERSFDGAAGKNLVELQWALLPPFYAVDLHVKDLLARAGRMSVGGCEVPCLAPEDSLLTLCLHTAKHLWTRLIWISDIAQTLRSSFIDWPLVVSRARDVGITRILGVSFWLVKNLLHVELPEEAENMIAADSDASVLGREFAERLARGVAYDFESTEYFRLILRLRERRSDRWRYLWRLLSTPSMGDLAAVHLPEPLFPLYRVVRPLRLLRKLGQAFATNEN